MGGKIILSITYEPKLYSELKFSQMCESPGCTGAVAVVIAEVSVTGVWIAFCLEHFNKYGNKSPELVTNITQSHITLEMSKEELDKLAQFIYLKQNSFFINPRETEETMFLANKLAACLTRQER